MNMNTEQRLDAPRLCQALSAGNQTVVRARSPEELIQGLARVVVEVAGFPGAWIALAPSRELVPLPAARGAAQGRCEWFRAHCFRWGEPYRVAGPRPGLTTLVYPVSDESGPSAVLAVVSAAEVDSNVDALFREMAMDLGYGLRSLATEAHEAQLAAVLEQTSDIVAILDASLHFTYANGAASRLLGGGERPRALDRHLAEGECERLRGEVLTRVRRDGIWRGLGTLRGQGGEAIPVSQVMLAHRNGQGAVEHYSLICRDLTAERRLESECVGHVQRVEAALVQLVRTLSQAIELRDAYTAGHQRRVAEIAEGIARRLGLPEEECRGVHLAGLIHDVGKLSVPAEYLAKPARLSEAEFAIIKTHASAGYELVRAVDFPWPLADMVHQHHERLDGSGYPQGLIGEAICFGARILAVADVVEAMTSHRPYRPALGLVAALNEITEQRGSRYDAEVVDACRALCAGKALGVGGRW